MQWSNSKAGLLTGLNLNRKKLPVVLDICFEGSKYVKKSWLVLLHLMTKKVQFIGQSSNLLESFIHKAL